MDRTRPLCTPLAADALSAAIDLGIAAGATAAAPYLLWRFCRVRRWRTGFASRLGFTLPHHSACGGIWIHTVSAGELLSAEPLLAAVAAAVPDLPIVLSVTTEAAHVLASDKLSHIPHFFWPLDLSAVTRRVLAHVRPRLIVLLELELWPNFLLAADRFRIPSVVVNGRISERGARRWAAARPVARWLFGLIDHFAVQNAEYAGRLETLGVPPDRVSICGNMKFDVPRNEATPVAPVRERLSLSAGQPLVAAGCTHPGEEELLLDLVPSLGRPGLVLAPRHLERVPEVLKLVAARGYVPCTLSGTEPGQVLVVDEFGKLESIYRAADVVIIGGTFVPHGGHNMLEAARWGKPVVFGRSIDSFRDCALGLLARDAAVQVSAREDLEACLRNLLHSPDERSRLGARALAAWIEGSGAVHRYTRVVTNALRKENTPHG